MKKVFASLVMALVAIGCHSQVPPSPPPTVTLNWSAAITCGGSNPACAYVISRCTVASGQNTCASYTPLNQASPSSTTTYTDANPPTGVNVLYVAQTVQGGLTGQASGPSNGGTPLAVPLYPGTPGAPTATSVAMLAPPLVNNEKAPVVASLDGPNGPTALVAKVNSSR